MNKIFAILFLAFLTGCCTAPQLNPGATAGQNGTATSPVTGTQLETPKDLKIDEKHLEVCVVDPGKLDATKPVFALDVLEAHKTTVGQLATCADKQRELAKLLCTHLFNQMPFCSSGAYLKAKP